LEGEAIEVERRGGDGVGDGVDGGGAVGLPSLQRLRDQSIC
jgi:hypothetical protein